MEQINQLKTMRDEALLRLRSNPDFKLVNSLEALIEDLEKVEDEMPSIEAKDTKTEPEATYDPINNEYESVLADELEKNIEATVSDLNGCETEYPAYQ